MRNLVDDLRDAVVRDPNPWDETLYVRAADEIEGLRAAGEEMAAFMSKLPCSCVEGSNGEINERCEACGLVMDWQDACRG